MLYLLLTNEFSSLIATIHVKPVDTVSDQKIISFKIELGRKQKPKKKIQLWRIGSLNYETFNVIMYDLNKMLNEGSCQRRLLYWKLQV